MKRYSSCGTASANGRVHDEGPRGNWRQLSPRLVEVGARALPQAIQSYLLVVNCCLTDDINLSPLKLKNNQGARTDRCNFRMRLISSTAPACMTTWLLSRPVAPQTLNPRQSGPRELRTIFDILMTNPSFTINAPHSQLHTQ